MLGWMLTSSLCCAIVCGTTALMVIGKLPGEINMLIVLLNLLVMPFGFIGSQWFILRQYMRRVLGWLPATLIGGVLGIILASIVLVPLTFVLTEMDELEDIAINANIWLGAAWIFLGPFLFGIGISIPQALTLRRHVRGAFWWVVASMLGWAALWLSGLLAAVLLLALNSGDPPESKTVQVVFAMITGGTAGAAYAFITSIALVSMINRSHRAT
ncbi:MAG: hypothetical protein HC837_14955 [Chloroflexaceae bacterium]|nr:hypothetical protein [Chloroflexaceae bacterium]